MAILLLLGAVVFVFVLVYLVGAAMVIGGVHTLSQSVRDNLEDSDD